MNIIFDFGTHYAEEGGDSIWLQFGMALLGVVLGFGASLLIFYLEIRKDKKKEKQQNRIESRNRLKYFQLLLESIIKIFESQQQKVNEYIVEQQSNLLELKVLKQLASKDFIRLQSIDSKGVFEAWGELLGTNDDWIKDYKKVHSSLDFIEGSISEISRIHKNTTTECYQQLLRIKDIVDHIPDQLSSIAMQLANQLGEERFKNELYVFINEAIKTYDRLVEENAGLEKINAEFIEPLLTTILDSYKNLSFADQIMTLCKKARVKSNDVKTNVRHTISELSKIEDRTRESLNCLKETNEKLKNVP